MTLQNRRPAKRRIIRTLRHWKQRFDENAAFVWRRTCKYGATEVTKGDLVDTEVVGRVKLRRLWEAHWIELAEFEEVNILTGQVPIAPVGSELEIIADVQKLGGNWYSVTYGDIVQKIRGKLALNKALAKLADDVVSATEAKAQAAVNAEARAAFVEALELAAELEIPEDVSQAWTVEQQAEFTAYVAGTLADEELTAPEFIAVFVEAIKAALVEEIKAELAEDLFEEALEDCDLDIPAEISGAWTVEERGLFVDYMTLSARSAELEDDAEAADIELELIEIPDFLTEFVQTPTTTGETAKTGGETEASGGNTPPQGSPDADQNTTTAAAGDEANEGGAGDSPDPLRAAAVPPETSRTGTNNDDKKPDPDGAGAGAETDTGGEP